MNARQLLPRVSLRQMSDRQLWSLLLAILRLLRKRHWGTV